jgi:hypothetical protein
MNPVEIEKNILRALNAAAGVPLPESALVRAVQNLSPPEKPTVGDVLAALQRVETKKLVEGVSEELMETTWTLTYPTGAHKARKLS